MAKAPVEEELRALRALLNRLQAREAALLLELEQPPPPKRAGWPIRRLEPERALH